MSTNSEPQPRFKSTFERNRVITDYSSQPSLTKSEFKDECDINNVVKRALRTGVLPGVDREALYGDFSQVEDYATAQIKIAEAKSEFEQLPSGIKEKFDNDVANLLDFVDDPENEAEAIKLGLLPEQVEQIKEIEPQEPISESKPVQDSDTVDS
jgi:phage internal scaffolding protein